MVVTILEFRNFKYQLLHLIISFIRRRIFSQQKQCFVSRTRPTLADATAAAAAVAVHLHETTIMRYISTING